MHVAEVTQWGSAPEYKEVPDLPAPGPSHVRLKILASAVHRLVQMRAAGQHFSAKAVPLDPSSDGVGLDESTGQCYYIATFAAGTFAEYANVDRARIFPLPQAADPVSVAALTNPVTSSWMSLRERVVGPLPAGFSVLILGVTSTSGRAAVEVCRALGAGRVVGAARSETALQGIKGLDGRVVLKDPVETTDLAAAGVGHVDIVLDYVWGKAALAVMSQLQIEAGRDTTFVQIGSVGGDEAVALPAQLLRSKAIRLVGSAPGSWSMAALGRELPDLLKMVAKMERPADVYAKPLNDVSEEWNTVDARKKRLVLVP